MKTTVERMEIEWESDSVFNLNVQGALEMFYGNKLIPKFTVRELPEEQGQKVINQAYLLNALDRIHNALWILYGEHDRVKREICFTRDAMEQIINMICKILLTRRGKEQNGQ